MASKKKIILFSIIGLVFVAAIFVYFYIFSSSIVPAQVNVESGTVLVNDKPITDNVKLKQGDNIETKENSYATVILQESVVINLNPNTKISIEDLVKENLNISQEKGETWNTFTKLFGVESYTVKTGTNIASVRGTAFNLKENYLIVGEGNVSFSIDGKNLFILAGRVAEKKSGKLIERNASAEEKLKMKENMQRTIKELRFLRNKEIERNSLLLSIAEKKTGMDKQEMIEYLETELDTGNTSVDEFLKQSPIQTDSVKKIAEITKSIQKINQEIKSL
jgi:ribosomal protein S4